MHTFLTILAALTWARAGPPTEPVIVDRVIVVVGDDVITASDIDLTLALDERDQTLARELAHPKVNSIQRLIDGAIIRQLAGNVDVYQPTPGQVRARVEAFQHLWPESKQYHHFLSAHGMDEARLFAHFFSRLVIDAYIHRNLSFNEEIIDPAEKQTRYAEWIAPHRKAAHIRHVAPQPPP